MKTINQKSNELLISIEQADWQHDSDSDLFTALIDYEDENVKDAEGYWWRFDTYEYIKAMDTLPCGIEKLGC